MHARSSVEFAQGFDDTILVDVAFNGKTQTFDFVFKNETNLVEWGVEEVPLGLVPPGTDVSVSFVVTAVNGDPFDSYGVHIAPITMPPLRSTSLLLLFAHA